MLKWIKNIIVIPIIAFAIFYGSFRVSFYISTKLGKPIVYTLQDRMAQTTESCVYVEVQSHYTPYLGVQKWSGSGVIVSPDGIIITAGHVVKNADVITVTLNNGKKYIVTNYYKEKTTDIGIIKIEVEEELSFVDIGNSDELKIGDRVYIGGNPFGDTLFNTITCGIVAGLNRNIPLFGEKLLLQVDAASWPGNSGGGAFNTNGEVIGILVGGYRGYDDLSICVPSNIVRLVLAKYVSEQYLVEARCKHIKKMNCSKCHKK